MKKITLTAAIVATTLLSPSCQGPNKLFTGVNDWNAELSDKDWLNTSVFWAFHIIPVYEVAYFIDIFVTNTVDYWKERND